MEENGFSENSDENEKKRFISQEKIMELLESLYNKCITGIPGTKNCVELAEEYLTKHNTPKEAAKRFTTVQIAKCSTSGFVTGLGGLITLPVAIPANIASVIYVQMRMIATMAVMGGYDVNSDETQTLVYLCLVNKSITDICKSAGINISTKTTTSLLKKVPGSVLTKINQKVGFRLFTKFGEKGVINLVKLVPVAGGLVGAGFDFVGTKVIAKKAYKTFLIGVVD